MLEGAQSLSEFDVITIIIVLTSAILALLRGFIKESLALIRWLGAGIISFISYPIATELLGDIIQNSVVVTVIGIIAVFIVSFVCFSIIIGVLLDSMEKIRRGPVDSSLGFLFGLLRGYIIIALIHYIIIAVHPEKKGPEWLQAGETYQITEVGANIIKAFAKKYGPSEKTTEELLENSEELLENSNELLEESKEELMRLEENVKEEYSQE